MSYKREDERYNEDLVKSLRNAFDYETGPQQPADPDAEEGEDKPPAPPRLRIVGDSRDTGKRKRR